MKTAALCTLVARYAREALSILSVSDHLPISEALSSEERETSFCCMVEIGLHAIVATAPNGSPG